MIEANGAARPAGVRSLAAQEYGPPSVLRVERLPRRDLAAHEVRVRVAFAGVNFPDLLAVAGEYQDRRPFPLVPGLECSGTVVETGDRASRFRPGDRVVAVPMHGSMAEEIVLDEEDVYALADSVSLEQGAALAITYGTAWHALADRGRLQAGETVLINGASGGIGSAAIDLAKHFGAVVIAVVGGEEKRRSALERGADFAIDSRAEDVRAAVKEVTAGRGVDLACDSVGGSASADALGLMAWGGRLLVIGFASGTIPQIPANRLLLKGCSAVGVYWGRLQKEAPDQFRRVMEQVIAAFAGGRLREQPPTSVPLDEVPRVLELMREHGARGKYIAALAL